MVMPNFFIVGAAKSGTTALYDYLKQHPQVFMSENKEPFFFAMEGKPIDFKGPRDQEILTHQIVNDISAYEALFAGVTNEIAIGEASTIYLYDPACAQRIYDRIPDARIIIGLRNPVGRAFSSYMHLRRDGREPLDDFEAAMAQEERRIKEGYEPLWHYRRVGLYYDSLKRYYDIFPREHIYVYLFEDLRRDSLAVTQAIFAFLGVNPGFRPDTEIQHNVSGAPKNRYLHEVHNFLLRPHNPIKDAVKPLLPERIRKRMLHSVVDHIREINMERGSVDPEVQRRMIEYFHEDILKVQDFIERDLSSWLVVKE
jgi:hypothetical protein